MELNPNHPVTQQARDQWYKICALLMHKAGLRQITITEADIDTFNDSGRCNIILDAKIDRLVLSIVDDKEAHRVSREHGGLPV